MNIRHKGQIAIHIWNNVLKIITVQHRTHSLPMLSSSSFCSGRSCWTGCQRCLGDSLCQTVDGIQTAVATRPYRLQIWCTLSFSLGALQARRGKGGSDNPGTLRIKSLSVWVQVWFSLTSFVIWEIYLLFLSLHFFIGKRRGWTECPSVDEWIKQLWHIYTME